MLAFHSKDFQGDYKVIYNLASLKLSDLKENHLPRVLLIVHANRKKHAQSENEEKSKLSGYRKDLAKGQTII